MTKISIVASELDAAHERARRAYAARDLATYMDTFASDLVYRQRDGRSIDRDQLAIDVRVQLRRAASAASEFHRTALKLGVNEISASEEGEQCATYEVRAFGIVRRIWNVRRLGRYEWSRGEVGWQIRRVEILYEEITSHVSLAFGRSAPAA